jgi:hypothetical protein
MIDRTKDNLRQESPFSLVWGGAICEAAILEYGLLVFSEYPNHHVVWPVAILIAVALTVYLGMRIDQQKRVKTYADRALNYLWGSWSAMLFIVLLFPAFNGYSWSAAYVFIVALYGMGTTISGGVLSFRPLIYGGIFSLVLAALTMVTGWHNDFPTMLLILAISILGSFLIPGFLLRRS